MRRNYRLSTVEQLEGRALFAIMSHGVVDVAGFSSDTGDVTMSASNNGNSVSASQLIAGEWDYSSHLTINFNNIDPGATLVQVGLTGTFTHWVNSAPDPEDTDNVYTFVGVDSATASDYTTYSSRSGYDTINHMIQVALTPLDSGSRTISLDLIVSGDALEKVHLESVYAVAKRADIGITYPAYSKVEGTDAFVDVEVTRSTDGGSAPLDVLMEKTGPNQSLIGDVPTAHFAVNQYTTTIRVPIVDDNNHQPNQYNTVRIRPRFNRFGPTFSSYMFPHDELGDSTIYSDITIRDNDGW